jgi:DNA-binding Xre family transcriptional regulator
MPFMKERLAAALLQRQRDPMDLVRELQRAKAKFSKATVYWILDGKTKPETVRADTVFRICDALNLNPRWLVYGKGSMDADHEIRQSQGAGMTQETIAAGIELLRDFLGETERPAAKLLDPDYLAAAIATYAEAGQDTPPRVLGIRFGERIRELESNANKQGNESGPVARDGSGSGKAGKP